jgi:hypothetical protein
VIVDNLKETDKLSKYESVKYGGLKLLAMIWDRYLDGEIAEELSNIKRIWEWLFDKKTN